MVRMMFVFLLGVFVGVVVFETLFVLIADDRNKNHNKNHNKNRNKNEDITKT